MKWLLFFMLQYATPIEASPPPPDWSPPRLIKGQNITLHWSDARHEPLLIEWIETEAPNTQLNSLSPQEKILSRSGLGKLPTRLLVIPKNNTLQPKIIPVDPLVSRVEFETSPILDNRSFLWGQTPKSPCPSPPSPVSIQINIRELAGTQWGENSPFLGGAFLWSLFKSGKETISFFVYDTFGFLSSITPSAFPKASAIQQSVCKLKFGSECLFLFEIPQNAWGHSNEIRFKAKTKPQCPV